ncbi:MAG: hypothetical protein ACREDN_09930 [Aestuariivirga sp.]
MFRKTLIALTAVSALSLGMAASAEAKTNINVDFGLGFGGYGYGYPPGYGYDYGYSPYEENCGWHWVKYKKWNPWHTAFIIKHKKVWSCY